jgi:trk system potassium uptake protein TrkH
MNTGWFGLVRVIGIFLLVYSASLIPPLLLAVAYQDGEFFNFLYPFLTTLGIGLITWLVTKNKHRELYRHEGFLIVAFYWIVMSLISATPLAMGTYLDFSDSFFEAVSAFTTTGATVITGIDNLPISILFYRQELQWLGGMGIIVLAVAILPILGMGGMQLYKAETPGPMKDEKLTPRIVHTAQALWFIYIGLTVACAIAYWIAGMPAFDAIVHSFSTLSTGGFSTHDASMAYFDSVSIELVAVVFMYLSSISFGLHFIVFRHRSLRHYFASAEVKLFTLVITVVVVVSTIILYRSQVHEDLWGSLRASLFQTVSVISSTGYTSEDFSVWPLATPVLLIFVSFMGGCAGSTAGGIKCIRFVVMIKQSYNEILKLIHPNLIRPLKVSGRPYQERVINAVWGFFVLYVAIFAVFMLILMAGGTDQVTAFGAVATCMNNLGPGLGKVATNFQNIPDWQKWLLAFAMLLGRLEIFTLLVLVTPTFWRR